VVPADGTAAAASPAPNPFTPHAFFKSLDVRALAAAAGRRSRRAAARSVVP
jgi:hypothetical protein